MPNEHLIFVSKLDPINLKVFGMTMLPTSHKHGGHTVHTVVVIQMSGTNLVLPSGSKFCHTVLSTSFDGPESGLQVAFVLHMLA